MAKKKYLTTDPLTGKLSRLKAKDLPMIGLKGLDDGDPIAEFGSLTNDIILILEDLNIHYQLI